MEILEASSRTVNVLVADIIEQGKVERLDRLLSAEELRGIHKANLRIIPNSILARYGYTFKSADLKSRFSRFSWYKPVKNEDAIERLNNIDKKNIQTILAIEKKYWLQPFLTEHHSVLSVSHSKRLSSSTNSLLPSATCSRA